MRATCHEGSNEVQDRDRGDQKGLNRNLASRRRSVLSVDLHPRRRSSEVPEVAEGSLVSQWRSRRSMDPRSGRRSRVTSPQREGMYTAYRQWEEPSFTRRSSPVSQRRSDASKAPWGIERSPGQGPGRRSEVAESNLASRRRSVLSVDLHPRRRSSEAPEVAEGSLVSQRRSGWSMDPRSGRRSRLTTPQKEEMYTTYHQWEEPSFTLQSRRKSSPAPQKELSLMDHTGPPPATRYGWEIDREDPSARTRVRTEPPLSPLHENTVL